MSIIITNGKIITCNEILTGYSIYVKDKKISKILRSKDIKKIKDPNLKKINAGNRYISPGLIDVHIQGFKGYDVWDNKKDSISKMSHSILFSGTTS
ncbi:MAG: N-acetylglucosamine-6-phosphate deacetylase, partial [Spirochaetes bacterium]|nr:N-acetylglucosamine-6-phosphate deacetylase [Spirochaetota bacterium]